jgi:hypothetical protein
LVAIACSFPFGERIGTRCSRRTNGAVKSAHHQCRLQPTAPATANPLANIHFDRCRRATRHRPVPCLEKRELESDAYRNCSPNCGLAVRSYDVRKGVRR